MDTIFSGNIGRIQTNTLVLTDKAKSGECTVKSLSNQAWLSKGVRLEYEALITSDNLALSESGKTFTNDGASVAVVATLPPSPGAGIEFHFIRIASQAFRINPQNSDAIIYSGGQMSDGEYLELASNGAKLSLISDTNNNWIATLEFGTLTEETP